MHDGITNDYFNSVLNICDGRVKALQGVIDIRNPQNIIDMHNNNQDCLWSNIQCHPQYNRSISLIFTKHMNYTSPLDSKIEAFHSKFTSL
jgi:hypothetical protein